jgi:site-specific DNA-cytosine methylase
LDCFSGIGGLSLGVRRAFKPIAFVEIDPAARGVLAARIRDGVLEEAPLLADIKDTL